MKNLVLLLVLVIFFACNAGKKTVDSEIGTDCVDTKDLVLNSCTDEYLPVCGCNDKTYSNECAAKNAGVKKWKNGPCPSEGCIDESKINPNAACAMIYKPVCGCDGKIYANECSAINAGVTQWKNGPCPPKGCIDESKINPSAPCTKIYKPVCGCDGKKYANACLAENNGVTKWKEGDCDM